MLSAVYPQVGVILTQIASHSTETCGRPKVVASEKIWGPGFILRIVLVCKCGKEAGPLESTMCLPHQKMLKWKDVAEKNHMSLIRQPTLSQVPSGSLRSVLCGCGVLNVSLQKGFCF